MPKRTLEDTELNSGDNDIKVSSKKSRKEKREKKSKDVEEPATDSTPTEVEVESKEARKERRRLKKAKKAQEAEKEANREQLDEDNAIEPASDGNAAADAKAAKKVEKARLKALKREGKQERPESPKSTEPGAPVTVSPQQNGITYTEDSNLSALPQSEIDSFLTTNFITITDPLSTSATLRPLTKFDYLPITDPAQRAPFKDFKAPTPIQAAAWPFLLAGRDVIGVAETGSGKTMAFAVPCVRYMSSLPKNQKNKGPRAVVVSPTRELAMQSYEQIVKLAKASGLECVCVYGGVPKDEQIRALKTADIVVATPGRLNDLINQGCADLSKARYVVLDEADRMLDKGFEEEIRKIINTTPSLGKRQTLMFTATWPESVRELAATFMTSPVKIAIGDNPTGDLRANSRIVQKVEVVEPRDKEYRLMQLLKQYQSGSQKDDRILVFCIA